MFLFLFAKRREMRSELQSTKTRFLGESIRAKTVSHEMPRFVVAEHFCFLGCGGFTSPFPCFSSDLVQERRISRGHSGVIRADILAQNFGQGGRNPGKKTSISARTSMTRRRGRPCPQGNSKKTSVRKTLGLNFRSLTCLYNAPSARSEGKMCSLCLLSSKRARLG